MCVSEAKRAALKLVGSVTCSTLIFSPGGRIACGSGLHRVISARLEIVPHAWRRCSRASARRSSRPGMRFR